MIAVLALLCHSALAQVRDDEPQVWTSLDSTMKLSPDWRAGVELGFRTAADDKDELLGDLAVQSRHLDRLHAKLSYRLGLDEWQEVRVKHRFALDATLRMQTEGVKFRLRHRQTLRLPGADVSMKHVLRWRAKFSFPTDSVVEPYLSGEPFLLATPGSPVALSKMRLTAGTSFAISDQDFDVYYRYEHPIRDDKDPRLHILGIGFAFGVRLYK